MRKNTKKVDIIIIVVLILLVAVITFVCIGNKKEKKTENENGESTVEEEYKTLEDFKHAKIGIITGSVHDQIRQERFPEAEALYYNNLTDMITALMQKKIDAAALDDSVMPGLMQEYENLTYVDESMGTTPYGYAFPKSQNGERHCAEMSEYIGKIKEDGTYEELNEIWFGEDDGKQVVDMSGLTGENGTLKFATNASFYPFTYVKDGKYVGYDVDLAVRFCREYGYNIEIYDMDFSGLIPGVTTEKYDFAAACMTITDERKESVNFSEPNYESNIVLAVRKEGENGEEEKTVEDFTNANIGILTGSAFDKVCEEYFPEGNTSYYNSESDMALALSAGKIDGFIVDEPIIKELQIENSDIGYLSKKLGTTPYGVAFAKNEKCDKIRNEFDEFLEEIKSNGTYEEINEIWFGEDESKKVVDMTGFTGENGTLTFATDGITVPFSYTKNGNSVGYDIDMVVRFCKKYGYNLEISTMNFDAIIPSIVSGKCDFGASCMTITDERKESVNFSEPNYESNIVLAVRKADLLAEDGEAAEDNQGFFAGIAESFQKNFIREDRWKLIVKGIGTTLIITLLSAIFGTILAFLICMFRRTESRLAIKISDIYVRLLQGMPMVVLLMILYYVVFGNSGLNAIFVAVIGFSLNLAAYVSEMMRSGIESIDPGQREAALALGYTENQAFFKFIFPQAAVRFLPVYKGEIVSLLKGTSIVGYIAIQDLTKMSDIIRSRTYEAFFPLIVTAVIYFILAWVLTLLLSRVEIKVNPKKKKAGVKGVKINE